MITIGRYFTNVFDSELDSENWLAFRKIFEIAFIGVLFNKRGYKYVREGANPRNANSKLFDISQELPSDILNVFAGNSKLESLVFKKEKKLLILSWTLNNSTKIFTIHYFKPTCTFLRKSYKLFGYSSQNEALRNNGFMA